MERSAILLNHTDQTTCWDEGGREIPCAGTGQDADDRSFFDDRSRFEASGETVLDTLTGLEWPVNGGYFEFPLSWPEAGEAIEAMNRENAMGREDWRLPDRRELFSLVSHARVNPALPDGSPFQNVFNGYYWAADVCARLPKQAWYIHLGGGRVQKGMRHGSYMVLPVRSDVVPDPEKGGRFDRDGRLVRDAFTGRTWLLPDNRMFAPVTWQQALDYAAGLNARKTAGFGDWRLANIRELEGITDLSRHSPALPEAFGTFPGTDGFWSSTTSVYETRYAWVLYPQDGAVGVGFKPDPTFHALAVRAC